MRVVRGGLNLRVRVVRGLGRNMAVGHGVVRARRAAEPDAAAVVCFIACRKDDDFDGLRPGNLFVARDIDRRTSRVRAEHGRQHAAPTAEDEHASDADE